MFLFYFKVEDGEVSFCFVDGKEMHRLPWTELLTVHTDRDTIWIAWWHTSRNEYTGTLVW